MRPFCLLLFFALPLLLKAKNSVIVTGCSPVVHINASSTNICLGTSVSFTTTLVNAGTDSAYVWKKNNTEIAGVTTATFTSNGFKEGDIISCEYTCNSPCGGVTTVVSNAVTIHVVDDFTPVVSVANNDPLICEGELTVFTTTATYGNATPVYQWKVNDEIVGNNSPTYTTSSITNGAKVECTLTAFVPGCASPPKTSTSQMNIYVYPMIHPTIKITPATSNICRGEAVTFTATANGGAYPSFAWQVNGVTTGPNAPSLTKSDFKDGDTLSCIITIDQDSRCHTTTSAPSNDVIVHVRDYPDPTFSINSSDLDVCKGSAIMFTTATQNAGDYKSYQWFVNGQGAGNFSNSFISSDFKNGDKVSCTLTTNIPGCALNAVVPSNEETVTVRDAPVITFMPPAITIMSGETAQIQATVTGTLTSFTWQPSAALVTPESLTTATIPLARDTVFTLSVVDYNGCTASAQLPIKVLHKLFMPSAFTPNSDARNDVFRIPADASILLQRFDVYNRWGNVVFTTNDIAKGWDGKYQGKEVDAGTYVYIIKGKVNDKEVTLRGTVTLLR